MPQPRSLAYRTDLFCLGAGTQVIERDGYLAIRSPEHPRYFWGNLLLFEAAPSEEDVRRWPALFAEEFADMPDVRHRTFGWDDPTAAPGAALRFTGDGYEIDHTRVLRTGAPHAPAKVAADVEVRALDTDQDWASAYDNQMACRPEHFDESDYGKFKKARMRAYRQLAGRGHGAWYGAFQGRRLVADLGVFHDGVLGRYQAVGTHPDFRRRGLAGTLVHRAGLQALASFGIDALVMCAAVDEPPERIYRSCGFEPVEEQIGLCWWPREDAGSSA